MKGTLLICFLAISHLVTGQYSEMALVKGGDYIPLYGAPEDKTVAVRSFYMDVTPVTRARYLQFVNANPKWRKSKVARLFADENYLADWDDDFSPGEKLLESPVNNVSWFAAKAYCECQRKRLPTVHEWEFAAMADEDSPDARKDSLYNQRIIRTYESASNYRQRVGDSPENFWGIRDLHSLVWEWTLDFNSVILTGESRKQDNTINLFCAGGSIGASDLMNYAGFMRYALRSSLKASFTMTHLGFRCVKEAKTTSF